MTMMTMSTTARTGPITQSISGCSTLGCITCLSCRTMGSEYGLAEKVRYRESIVLIKNTVKTVILWNLITITVSFFNIIYKVNIKKIYWPKHLNNCVYYINYIMMFSALEITILRFPLFQVFRECFNFNYLNLNKKFETAHSTSSHLSPCQARFPLTRFLLTLAIHTFTFD